MLTTTTSSVTIKQFWMLSLSTYDCFRFPPKGDSAMNKMRFPGLSRVLPTSNVWIRTKEIVTAVLSAIALIALAGFASGSADEDHEMDRGASKAAIERFWSVYHGNEYSAIPQVQAQLQNAL